MQNSAVETRRAFGILFIAVSISVGIASFLSEIAYITANIPTLLLCRNLDCRLWCSVWGKLHSLAQSDTCNPGQDEDKHQVACGCKGAQWDLLGRTFCWDRRFSIIIPVPYPHQHRPRQLVDIFYNKKYSGADNREQD